MKTLILIISLLVCPSLSFGQPNTPCSNNSYNVVVANSTGSAIYMCGTNNTWVNITPSNSGLPIDSIALTLTSCPTGFIEATELNGLTLIGTLAANKDVGTTGGNNNITPSGSISQPIFTGNAITQVINHVHTLATGTGATGNFSQVIGTVDTTSGGTGATPTQTTLGTRTVATVNGVASITPTGSVSAPNFSGVQFDNRSAFIKVIFCKKV